MNTNIKSTKSIYSALRYMVTDKKHQQVERVANMRVAKGMVATKSVKHLTMQFAPDLQLARRLSGRDIQGQVCTYSFSNLEINTSDPNWAEKALNVCFTISENLRPNCSKVLVAQADGKSGHVHVHEVCSEVDHDLNVLHGRATNSRILYSLSNEIMEDQFGITMDPGEDHSKRKKNAGQRRQEYQEKTSGYSWMKDLQSRIDAAIAETTATGDFEKNLNAHGVSVTRKRKSGWSFMLDQAGVEEYKGRHASFTQFENDYSMRTLNLRFKDNYYRKRHEEAEAKRLLEEEERKQAEEYKRKLEEDIRRRYEQRTGEQLVTMQEEVETVTEMEEKSAELESTPEQKSTSYDAMWDLAVKNNPVILRMLGLDPEKFLSQFDPAELEAERKRRMYRISVTSDDTDKEDEKQY